MGVQELINDIRRGKYEYETMLYTNATYTFLDKNNKIVKEIPNPIIMKDFFRKPVKIHLSEDNTKLINELGKEILSILSFMLLIFWTSGCWKFEFWLSCSFENKKKSSSSFILKLYL